MYYNSAMGDVQNDFMEPLIPEIKDCYTDAPYKTNKEKYLELFEKEMVKKEHRHKEIKIKKIAGRWIYQCYILYFAIFLSNNLLKTK